MFKTSIKSRVMKIISDKIKEAQKQYEQESKDLDEQLASTIYTAKMLSKKAQIDLVEKHVNNIIGKIL